MSSRSAPAGRRPGLRPRTTLFALAVAALAGGGGGTVLHAVLSGSATRVFEPALPTFHGQASWRPGVRPAPGFALRDQSGATVSLAGERGRPVIVTFLDSRCTSLCPIEGRMLGEIERSLAPRKRAVLLIVSVDPPGDTPASVRKAGAHWALAGDWRWLNGTPAQLRAVWRSYGITVRETTHDIQHGAGLYLVDRKGFERAGYLFPFEPGFVARDIRTLAGDA